jgi:hypothetical protein
MYNSFEDSGQSFLPESSNGLPSRAHFYSKIEVICHTSLRTDHQQADVTLLVEAWKHALQEDDRSPGTIKKYPQPLPFLIIVQQVEQFLSWYEQEGRMSL